MFKLILLFSKALQFIISNIKLIFKFCKAPSNSNKCKKKLHCINGLPLIGTLLDFIKAGGPAKQYGEIFRENLCGQQDAVFISSASLMKRVFQFEGQYPKHPLPESWLLYNKIHKIQRGLLFMNNEEWFRNRKIMNPIFLNGNLEWVKKNIYSCNKKFVERWQNIIKLSRNECFEIQDLEEQLYRWSIDVMCAIMFGSKACNDSELVAALDKFSKVVYKIFESSSALMSFPASTAKFFKMKTWKTFEKDVTDVLNDGAAIIQHFIENSHAAEETETFFHKLLESGMCLHMVKRIFIDLVIAAGDTTSYSAEWAIYLLAKYRNIQEQLAGESLHFKNEKFLFRGFIKETLRLYPVAPFIGRILEMDAVIDEYRIERGTLVLLSLYTSGRNENHFSDPLRVKPDRWSLKRNVNEQPYVHQPNGSIPFGVGNRSCIGRRIALYQLESFVEMITANFIVKCKNVDDITPILRLVTVPSNPLQLVIQKRT